MQTTTARRLLPYEMVPVGIERARLSRLLFGYVLGLDKWLAGVPMQFLLLDLGYVDLPQPQYPRPERK